MLRPARAGRADLKVTPSLGVAVDSEGGKRKERDVCGLALLLWLWRSLVS